MGPEVLKDILIRIVEMINPEFLITVLNLSVLRNEISRSKTSDRIRTVKKLSKNILSRFIIFSAFSGPVANKDWTQVNKLKSATAKKMGTRIVATTFFI